MSRIKTHDNIVVRWKEWLLRERGATFKEVPDPGGSAGREGIAWIRTKESLKTKGNLGFFSSPTREGEAGRRLPSRFGLVRSRVYSAPMGHRGYLRMKTWLDVHSRENMNTGWFRRSKWVVIRHSSCISCSGWCSCIPPPSGGGLSPVAGVLGFPEMLRELSCGDVVPGSQDDKVVQVPENAMLVFPAVDLVDLPELLQSYGDRLRMRVPVSRREPISFVDVQAQMGAQYLHVGKNTIICQPCLVLLHHCASAPRQPFSASRKGQHRGFILQNDAITFTTRFPGLPGRYGLHYREAREGKIQDQIRKIGLSVS